MKGKDSKYFVQHHLILDVGPGFIMDGFTCHGKGLRLTNTCATNLQLSHIALLHSQWLSCGEISHLNINSSLFLISIHWNLKPRLTINFNLACYMNPKKLWFNEHMVF